MQVLYAQSQDDTLRADDVMKAYRASVRNSFELYLYNLQFILQVAQYAGLDLQRRKAMLRPSDEDRKFTARLADNDIVHSLLDHAELKRSIRAYKLEEAIDEDQVRQLYTSFAGTKEYLEYLALEEPTAEDHINILLALYKSMLGSEIFTDMVEDAYPLWIDDESLTVGAIKKTLRALPAELLFLDDYRPSKEATVEFGEELLRIVCRDDKQYFDIIEPTLKNWDAERVATIDMILLKMALAELMHFPSIPTKVTLNEFVEISKLYSTDKSKDFINGILDRLMKNLTKEGKIVKEGRGLHE
jgi:transcription antitermination protein NusB